MRRFKVPKEYYVDESMTSGEDLNTDSGSGNIELLCWQIPHNAKDMRLATSWHT